VLHQELEDEIDRLRLVHPHLEKLLSAFGPLLVEKERWLSEIAVGDEGIAVNVSQLAEGIPVSRQHQLFSMEDPWASASWSVAGAIKAGFPHLERDIAVLLPRVTAKRVEFFAEFMTNTTQTAGQIAVRAAMLDISPISLYLFLRHLYNFMLGKKARDIPLHLPVEAWLKGYCPFCGSLPHMALLGEGGLRSLQCGDCGNTWQFTRLACPCCSHVDSGKNQIVYLEGEKDIFAVICATCGRYLLTVSHPARFTLSHPQLIALCLVPLDCIVQGKGYLPMAEYEWNILDILGWGTGAMPYKNGAQAAFTG
jgi:FdhE protein